MDYTSVNSNKWPRTISSMFTNFRNILEQKPKLQNDIYVWHYLHKNFKLIKKTIQCIWIHKYVVMLKKIRFFNMLNMLMKKKYDNMRDYAGLDLTVREGFLKKYAWVTEKDPVLRWGREPSVLHSLGFKRLSGIKSYFVCHFTTVWPWASYLTSLWLSITTVLTP